VFPVLYLAIRAQKSFREVLTFHSGPQNAIVAGNIMKYQFI